MAQRPIYVPSTDGVSLVRELPIEFKWYAGLSVSQKQKSIRSLHDAAESRLGDGEVLEISSKSESDFGRRLSAFTLRFSLRGGQPCTVECAFQGSKVFRDGGPYSELFGLDSRAAKKDERIRSSGGLVAFQFEGERWPLDPKTCFYDWIYITALHQDQDLREAVLGYAAFSDIEFNPQKSINCQAQSAARYVALHRRGLLEQALSDRTFFIGTYGNKPVAQHQGSLFD